MPTIFGKDKDAIVPALRNCSDADKCGRLRENRNLCKRLYERFEQNWTRFPLK